MKKLYYSLATLLFVAAGCSNNDNGFMDNEGTAPVAQKRAISSVTATMEGADTRVLLADGKQVVWNNNDFIWVAPLGESAMANRREHNFVPFQIADGIGTTTGTFLGEEIVGDSFIALYPGDFFNWDGADNLTIAWNYENNVVFGGDQYANYTIPMFAKEISGVFQFKQLGGLLHFQVTGTGQLIYAQLARNDGQPFYDAFKVNFSADEPTISEDKNYHYYRDYIISKPHDLIELSDTPTDLYFVLPAGMTFEKGLTLTLTVGKEEGDNYTETQVVKKSTKAVTVNRGKVKHYPLYDADEAAQEGYQKQYNALMELHKAMGEPAWENWGTNEPFNTWFGLNATETNVTGINIYAPNVTGSIPNAIGDLPLTSLVLRGVQLTSISGITKLTGLKELALTDNGLKGNLPEEISELKGLDILQLNDNEFEGNIPDSWLNNLNNIHYMEIRNNKLSGKLTKEMQMTPMWQRAIEHGFWNTFVYSQQEGFGIEIEDMIEGILLNQQVYTLAVGQTAQLDLTVLPKGSMADLRFEYDSNVISVDENGVITALRLGSFDMYIYPKLMYNYVWARVTINVMESSTDTENEEFFDEDGTW